VQLYFAPLGRRLGQAGDGNAFGLGNPSRQPNLTSRFLDLGLLAERSHFSQAKTCLEPDYDLDFYVTVCLG
jgi:hypothetical protein